MWKKTLGILMTLGLFFSFLMIPYVGSGAPKTIGVKNNDWQEKENRNQRPTKERIYQFELQLVTVEDFEADGFILDIGGGGEGVIGQLKGQQVIAIDISKRELEEAPPGPLKIIMDARDLKFLDNTFKTATVFFTFMYIDSGDHGKVLEELFRVLAPGGHLLIWDVVFPEWKNDKKDLALFPLKVKLPEKEIRTGYGVRRPKQRQGLTHFVELVEKAGFKIITKNSEESWFFLEVLKPN
jgi:ubiquinone/menaquinone biosynthesis C-methylase UbiE